VVAIGSDITLILRMVIRRNVDQLLTRPLSARSVVASLLLGMHPPRLAGARLVRWCGVFGITEGTARVALSRMVDRGELEMADAQYELAGPVRARQRVQEWGLEPELGPWDGRWRMGAVRSGARAADERAALRDAMRRLRHAELREGVWVRPANLPRASGPADAWDVAGAQCEWWTGEPDADARALAIELYAPDAWAVRARALHRSLTRATASLDDARDTELAHAFEAGAAVLAHVRADPLLPAPLCPAPWPGDALRAAYSEYRVIFGAAVREWFRAEA
jgi:phenylacetic acid degradation operon negative regulatory protein